MLRGALRMHNELSEDTEVPEQLLSTLAESYMSPTISRASAKKSSSPTRVTSFGLGAASRRRAAANSGKSCGKRKKKKLFAAVRRKLLKSKDKPLAEQDKLALGFLNGRWKRTFRNVTAAVLVKKRCICGRHQRRDFLS